MDKQTYFVWYRADKGYYWDNGARPGGLFKAGKEKPYIPDMTAPPKDEKIKPPFLIEKPETTGFIPYTPLEDETTLFLVFSETPPNKEGILKFANQYGMLINGETEVLTPQYSHLKDAPPTWQHGNTLGGYEQKDGRIYRGVWGESLKFWQDEINYMHQTVQVWEWLLNHDMESLKKAISWNHDFQISYTLDTEKGFIDRDFHSDIFARFKPGDVLLPAQYLIQLRINKKLDEYATSPHLLMNEENKLETYLMPKNLLAALWLQFHFAAAGIKRFKRCTVCGEWEDVTTKNRNWSKHPACAARERVNKYREKQKYQRADEDIIRLALQERAKHIGNLEYQQALSIFEYILETGATIGQAAKVFQVSRKTINDNLLLLTSYHDKDIAQKAEQILKEYYKPKSHGEGQNNGGVAGKAGER